jgi:hypothetical protein
MSHECDECGQECYCDGEDTGGMPQPLSCPHIFKHSEEDELDGPDELPVDEGW